MSAGLSKRLTVLKTVNTMIEEISILIRYKASTVFEIMDTLCKDKRFTELNFISSVRDNCTDNIVFSDNWENAVKEFHSQNIKPQDYNLINTIGQNLGSSDIDGQLSTLALEKEELKALIEEAENDYRNKSKLYRSLGVLTGAFITVLLV